MTWVLSLNQEVVVVALSLRNFCLGLLSKVNMKTYSP